MILALDIGNSRVKCALVDADRVLGRESIPTRSCAGGTALDDMVRRVSSAALSVERSIVSSVVPSITVAAIRAIERHMGRRPRLVDHRVRLPFRLAVANPAAVGTDRLCAAAGATGTRRRHAIVVDAGSAVTVDVVRDGVFRGGVIAAGPELALRALGEYASRLPRIDFSRLETPFPKRCDDTAEAMALGAGLGGVGVVREAVRFLEGEFGPVSRKTLTGGAAPALLPRLPRSWVHVPDLTLTGMFVIACLNRRESD